MSNENSALTKEQKVAYSVLQQNWQNIDKLLMGSQTLKRNGPLLKTNFVGFSFYPIEKTTIPVDNYWCWNQSNAKVSVQIDMFTTITFRKVSTKKKSSSTLPAPSFKIWLFEIESMISASKYFIWCEKGVTEQMDYIPHKGVYTEIGTIFPEALNINNFSFLRPFVEDT